MAEVVVQKEKPDSYDYSEPPRDSVAHDKEVKILSGETLDVGLVQSDYPRFTSNQEYGYVEPPRETRAPEEFSNNVAIPVVPVAPIQLDVSSQNRTDNAPVMVIEDDTNAMNFKARIKAKKIPEELNIHSFILMLVGSQNLFLLGTLVMIDLSLRLNITFVTDFLALTWWVPYVALGIYAILYLVLWRFQQRISISASCFFLIQIALACESTFIVYANLTLGIELGYLFCGSFQMIACVYTAAFVAQCMKKSYTGIVGRLIAMGPSLVCLTLYVAFAEGAWNVVAYVIISFFVSLYVWFLITKIDEFVEVSGGRDTILSGIFCSLLVIKKKIEWVLRIVVFPYTIYLIIQGEKLKKDPQIIEPLLEQPKFK